MKTHFVDLSENRDALLDLLRDLDLAAADETPAVRPIRGGVSSNIFCVDLHRGPVCVKQALPTLRVEKGWHVSTDRIFAEIDWLHLADQLVPDQVPHVLGTDEVLRAFIMEYLPSETHLNWKQELLAGRPDETVGVGIGDLLGKLHSRTAHDAEIARRFAHTANFFQLRLDPYLLEAARQHPDLSCELVALVRATQTNAHALVHGDVSPKNILIRSGIPILLDAECAWYGDPAFDLAFLLSHVLLKSMVIPAMTAAWNALFCAIVDSYLPYVEWEHMRVFESRATALLPGLLLSRIDGKSPVEYLDDAQRKAVRKVARDLLSRTYEHFGEVFEKFETTVLALRRPISHARGIADVSQDSQTR